MTGFELQTSGFGSNRSANGATTTAQTFTYIDNDWIWTADLWYWKQPLCQLSHDYCPNFYLITYLYYFQFITVPTYWDAKILKEVLTVLVFVDVKGTKDVKRLISLFAITDQFIPWNRRGSERLRKLADRVRKQMLINTHNVNRCEWRR